MEDGELAVSGRMDIKFDDIGTGLKAGFYRRKRILQVAVRWRQHTGGCAGVILEVTRVKLLRDASVDQQCRRSRPMGCEQAGVVEINEQSEQKHAQSKCPS
jgi:hypothetical protein